MKKVLRILLYILSALFFFCVVVPAIAYFIWNFDRVASLVTGSYPAVGDYYILFDYDEMETVTASVYYRQDIYEEPINLSNLELHTQKGTGYSIDKDDIWSESQIRKLLLKRGLAKIIDESIADPEEISCQREAEKYEYGMWHTEKNDRFFITILSVLDKIRIFCKSNLAKILEWIIFTGLGLSTIFCFIRGLISRRRIDVILMGGISSGKTSIVKRMQRPNITEGKLLAEATATKAQEIVQCDRIAYNDKDIYPYLYDNRGDGYGEMVDAINKFGLRKSNKKVMIYVITFTESDASCKFDDKLANSQISKAAVMIRSFKTSRSLKKVKKIIVFFNKCDLLYQDEAAFLKNKKNIENQYESATDYREVKDYADAIIFGSALKGWGIDDLQEEILNIK